MTHNAGKRSIHLDVRLPADRETLTLQTLQNPTTVGQDNFGPMANFDPSQSYAWPFVQWATTYTGPVTDSALNAATVFDATGFQNPTAGGAFGWHLDAAGRTLALTFTPVPEPGTLALLAAAAAAAGYCRWRRVSSSPAATPLDAAPEPAQE